MTGFATGFKCVYVVLLARLLYEFSLPLSPPRVIGVCGICKIDWLLSILAGCTCPSVVLLGCPLPWGCQKFSSLLTLPSLQSSRLVICVSRVYVHTIDRVATLRNCRATHLVAHTLAHVFAQRTPSHIRAHNLSRTFARTARQPMCGPWASPFTKWCTGSSLSGPRLVPTPSWRA